jgi:TonB family protein
MKLVIVIGLLLGIISSSLFAQVDSSLNVVDIPPLFEGCNDPLVSTAQRQACSAPKIQAFIRANITYPDSAKVHQAEGIVVVRFTVDETGVISQLELIRDIGHGCGQEAMRVVRMMPAFTPALRNGIPTATKMTLPIRFRKIVGEDKKPLCKIHWGSIYEEKIEREELKELVKQGIVVRDNYGNIYPVQYLSVQVVGKHKMKEEKGKNNTLTKKMQKLLLGTKRNQQIVFEATVLKDYQEIEVRRILYVQ